MPIPILTQRELCDQVEPGEEAGLESEIDLVPSLQAARGADPSVQHSIRRQLSPAETATTALEPTEVLVADARGGLTPVQMVEKKLLALLGSGYPGSYRQTTGRLEDLRRPAGY